MKPFKLQEPYYKVEKLDKESYFMICLNPLFDTLVDAKKGYKQLKNNERKARDLKRVIKALEYENSENYSSTRSLALSYLTDIENNRVPKKMVSDKK